VHGITGLAKRPPSGIDFRAAARQR